MRPFHEVILDAVVEERTRATSRRGFLSGAGKRAGAGALALAATAGPAMLGLKQTMAQAGSDIDILNYALTLEHLEYAFYRDGLAALGVFDSLLDDVRDHEDVHVDTLIQVISSLGGTPVTEQCYTFAARGAFDSQDAFLDTARVLENTGVMAYTGALAMIQSPELQTAGATIATVEARHASYLNLITGFNPFPAAFDDPATMQEILAAASPFFGDRGGDPAPVPTETPRRIIRNDDGDDDGNGADDDDDGDRVIRDRASDEEDEDEDGDSVRT
ncbi:MAG: ferritin-like domain-containing protein [Chloroflexia bacterium]|nr:ferritin-like domain-containing protein [Chloroflexia bacterium]MDQ3514651.1 ferritin-like domain-containing protein [Chloroflexota bacterium]